LWLVVVLALLGAGLVAAGGWVACDRGIHPPQMPPRYSISDFDLPVEDIGFPSLDGTGLAGWFVPGTNGAGVILAHGRGGSRADMLPHADYLHRAGFSVLLFDFRYRGQSEGEASTLGAREPLDILGAVRYLRAREGVSAGHIGVQGNSLGAAAAILATAREPDIDGVVAEIPFAALDDAITYAFEHPQEGVGLPRFPFAPAAKWICEHRLGIDVQTVAPVSVIGQISPRPILLIDNLGDDVFPPDAVDRLYQAAAGPKTLWQVRSAHGMGWERAPGEYRRRVLAFWEQVLAHAPNSHRRSAPTTIVGEFDPSLSRR
jgi:dienelactone hydrolase